MISLPRVEMRVAGDTQHFRHSIAPRRIRQRRCQRCLIFIAANINALRCFNAAATATILYRLSWLAALPGSHAQQ